MVSQKKLAANRLNAQRSTGPRTKEGKQKSRLNSTHHGLRSELFDSIVPQTDRQSFSLFQSEMLADLSPKGALETLLARRLSLLAYKLQRLQEAESLLFDKINDDALESVEEDNEIELEHHRQFLAQRPADCTDPPPKPELSDLPDPQSPPEILAQAYARDHEGAFDDLSDMLPKHSLMFARLQRYTTAAERSFHRTLKELTGRCKTP